VEEAPIHPLLCIFLLLLHILLFLYKLLLLLCRLLLFLLSTAPAAAETYQIAKTLTSTSI
jgi:hypothetical protein